MRTHFVRLAVFFIFSTCLASRLPAAEYHYSHEQSRITFTLRHLGLVTVEGHFSDFSGGFEFDLQNIEDSQVNLVIQTTSLESGNGVRDNDLRSKTFFWAEEFPEITFTSTAFGSIQDGQFKIYGDLTIRGKTVPVIFETELLTPTAEITEGQTLHFRTETYIHRKDFDLGTGSWFNPIAMITGETLKISLDVTGFPFESESGADKSLSDNGSIRGT